MAIVGSSYLTADEKDKIKALQMIYPKISQALKTRIVGLEETIEQTLIGILSGGHVLLVGVPGLAKTLLIRSLSDLMDLGFSRIQFTPDLMPSDITGTEVLVKDEGSQMRQFSFLKGPIFSNIILADEINRTPPKTQSALLEAMEESTVTSVGQKFELDFPFFVLATQNPVEQEGTYPLPAAQLDRFMFNLLLDYPPTDDEYKIIRKTLSLSNSPLEPILSKEQIIDYTQICRKINMPAAIGKYAISLCRASRPKNRDSSEFVKDYVAWGVSPRACQALILGGKARALLYGREIVYAEDIRAIVHSSMRHRILINYKAEADGITPDQIIDKIIQTVESPDGIQEVSSSGSNYNTSLYINTATMA